MGSLEAVPSASLPRFDTENVLWWFGAAVAGYASALVVFALPDSHHLLWIFLGLLVLNAFWALAAMVLLNRGWAVPGGLFVVLNTVFIIIAFGVLLHVLHLTSDNADPFNHFTWWAALIAFFALVASAFAFARSEFAFLNVITAGAMIALVYLLLPIVNRNPSRSHDFFVAAILGAIFMLGALSLDVVGGRRMAFWWHLSGLALLAIGLTHYIVGNLPTPSPTSLLLGSEESDATSAFGSSGHPLWAWLLLLAVGLLTLFVAGMIGRASWALFGIIESFAVLGHYTDKWTGGAWTAAILLVIGIVYVKLGVLFARNTTFWTATAAAVRLGPPPGDPPAEPVTDGEAAPTEPTSWVVRFYTAGPGSNPFPVWDGPNLLWWLGSALMLGTTIYLVDRVPDSQRHLWTLFVALGVVVIYAVSGRVSEVLGWRIPAGLMTFIAAVFATVAFGAFEGLIGVLPDDLGGGFSDFSFWTFLIFVVALICFLFAYGLSQFNFSIFGAATATLITLYLFNPALIGTPTANNYFLAALIFGLLFVVIGLRLDGADRRRAAFWWHFEGLLLVAVALAYHLIRPELTYFFTESFSENEASRPDTSWVWLVILFAGIVVLSGAALLHRANWGVWGLVGVFVPTLHYAIDWTGAWRTSLVIAIVGLVLMRIGGHIASRDEFWQRLRELPRGPRPTY